MKSKTEDEMYAMKLHQSMIVHVETIDGPKIEPIVVIRVPNGWLYDNVFVPLTTYSNPNI